MTQTVEINQGEIKIKFNEPVKGKVSLKDLGIESESITLESGLLRLVFDMEGIGEHHYFQVPTMTIVYEEEVGETHWQCDFNEETIVDKTDHHGHSTVILLNRKKLSELEHRHENTLILHAEFPQPVHLSTTKSTINFFN
ncbi:MAG: hypothetical protein N4A35_03745 [Flavobacteriales bacterium]|jgi:hypothetical protein|nr:hypothetical protein [Flavobacteriales bacterium]